MIKRNILLNPGPATTTDSVKYAQIVPDICPREKEFCSIMASIRKDLVKIVNGNDDYTSILFTGSGTAAMEATISSVIAPGKKILIINNGAYCERLKKICDIHKIDNIELKFKIGEKIDLEKVKKSLKRNKVNYVTTVHHETTTGIINPIEEIGKIAKENNCIFIVDTISSFAGIPIDVNKFNIDFMMSTSNKCIQGLAGCAFVICKRSELEKTKNFKRTLFLNLWSQYEHFEKTGEMIYTPPVQVIYALRKAIDEFFEEGAENRFNRYKENCKTLVGGLNDLGLKTSGGVLLTTVYEPDGFNFQRVHDKLYEKGFTIYPGKTGEKTFRLANIGAIDYKDIRRFLFEFKNIMDEIKLK